MTAEAMALLVAENADADALVDAQPRIASDGRADAQPCAAIIAGSRCGLDAAGTKPEAPSVEKYLSRAKS